MARQRVLVESLKKPGAAKWVSRRDANLLIVLGKVREVQENESVAPTEEVELAFTPSPNLDEAVSEPDEYEGMEYSELRRLVAERELTPEGRSRADYLDALRYNRRDMRAED